MRLKTVLFVTLLFALIPGRLSAECPVSETSFELYDLGDRLFSLDKIVADPATKLVVVDFFSMACAPCKRAMPRLSELQALYAADGLRVVVVAIPSNGERAAELERVRAFFEPLATTFPVVFDKYSVVARQYAVTDGRDAHLPQSFVIGGDGRVRNHFDDMNSVIEAIETVFGRKGGQD